MNLQDKRIFVVEDNIGNLTITKTLLEAHGAVVATHRSGHDVLPHLKNFLPVDLIILDLMLPSGVTGYDILSAIRNHVEFNNVPIIAMSAIDRSKVIAEAKKRGFSGYIGKPINFTEFPKQIAEIIAGASIW
jgi:two-component system, chemotaxis family, sensor kinase CheA